MAGFRCADKEGDQTFTARVTFKNDRVFSLAYEAMWMCEDMLSPRSTVGGMTFDLVDGRLLSLRDQFGSEDAWRTFRQHVLAKTDELIKANLGPDHIICGTPIRIGSYHLEPDGIVITPTSTGPSDPSCEPEIRVAANAIAAYLLPTSPVLSLISQTE